MDKEELVYICMYLIQTFSENNNKRGNTLQLFFYKVNGFPGGSEVKGSASYTEDLGSIPGSGRSPGEGIGYPLQYSWASLVAQLVKNQPAMQETWV